MSDSTPFKEEWLAGPQATQFYTRTYVPPASTPTKAAVLYVHGFAEHVGRYSHFHPLFAQRGIAVFAFDQRGHGLTAQDTSGKKSKTSAWGKTCWRDQMEDIEWALQHVKKAFPTVPLFLVGHSMGGAEVLGFATQGSESAHKEALALVKGVVATSPLIAQATPAPAVLKWTGAKASVLFPNVLIPADVNVADLSHDDAFNTAYLNDPLIKQSGSLRCISDMLSKGEALSKELYKNWPASLPVLIVHGNEDKVTSHKASQQFHDDIAATQKKYELFEGGYHELQNEPDGVKEKLFDIIANFVEGHLAEPAEEAPAAQKASL